MRICCASCQHWKQDNQNSNIEIGICKFRPPSWMRVHNTNNQMMYDDDCDFYNRKHDAEINEELIFN